MTAPWLPVEGGREMSIEYEEPGEEWFAAGADEWEEPEIKGLTQKQKSGIKWAIGLPLFLLVLLGGL